MALDQNINTLEKAKFEEVSSVTAVRVKQIGNLVSKTYDACSVTYPSATQEVYTFRTGGIAGTSVAVLTVNYTDSTKDFILNYAVT